MKTEEFHRVGEKVSRVKIRSLKSVIERNKLTSQRSKLKEIGREILHANIIPLLLIDDSWRSRHGGTNDIKIEDCFETRRRDSGTEDKDT